MESIYIQVGRKFFVWGSEPCHAHATHCKAHVHGHEDMVEEGDEQSRSKLITHTSKMSGQKCSKGNASCHQGYPAWATVTARPRHRPAAIKAFIHLHEWKERQGGGREMEFCPSHQVQQPSTVSLIIGVCVWGCVKGERVRGWVRREMGDGWRDVVTKHEMCMLSVPPQRDREYVLRR